MLDTSISLSQRFLIPYYNTAISYLLPVSGWPLGVTVGATILMGIITIAVAVYAIRKNSLSARAITLGIVLVFLLPLGMNTAGFLSGLSHDLMHYAIWFVFLFAVVLFERFLPKFVEKKEKYCKGICAALLICILWNNVVVSNTLYMKKDLEKEGAISVMTRVIARMEEMPGYVAGETPVAFIGEKSGKPMPGFEHIGITGAWSSNPISGIDETCFFNTYESFFHYFVNEPIVLCEENVRQALMADQRVIDMPAFPDRLSIQMLDGVLAVKMGTE